MCFSPMNKYSRLSWAERQLDGGRLAQKRTYEGPQVHVIGKRYLATAVTSSATRTEILSSEPRRSAQYRGSDRGGSSGGSRVLGVSRGAWHRHFCSSSSEGDPAPSPSSSFLSSVLGDEVHFVTDNTDVFVNARAQNKNTGDTFWGGCHVVHITWYRYLICCLATSSTELLSNFSAIIFVNLR